MISGLTPVLNACRLREAAASVLNLVHDYSVIQRLHGIPLERRRSTEAMILVPNMRFPKRHVSTFDFPGRAPNHIHYITNVCRTQGNAA